jgi:hypothetical protein
MTSIITNEALTSGGAMKSETAEEETGEGVQLRRSTRITRPPSRL